MMNGLYQRFINLVYGQKKEEEKRVLRSSTTNNIQRNYERPSLNERYPQIASLETSLKEENSQKASRESLTLPNNNILRVEVMPKQLKVFKINPLESAKIEVTKYFKNYRKKPTVKPRKEKTPINYEPKRNKLAKISEREPQDLADYMDNRIIVNQKRSFNFDQVREGSQQNKKAGFSGNMEITRNTELNICQKDDDKKSSQFLTIDNNTQVEASSKLIQMVEKKSQNIIEKKDNIEIQSSQTKNPFLANKFNQVCNYLNINLTSQNSKNTDSKRKKSDSKAKNLTESILTHNNLSNISTNEEIIKIPVKEEEKADEESPQTFNPNSTLKHQTPEDVKNNIGKSVLENSGKKSESNLSRKTDVPDKNEEKNEIKEIQFKVTSDIFKGQFDKKDKESGLETVSKIEMTRPQGRIENNNPNNHIFLKETERKIVETASNIISMNVSTQKPKEEIKLNNYNKDETFNNNLGNEIPVSSQVESLFNNRNNPFAPNSININLNNSSSMFMSSSQLDNPFNQKNTAKIGSFNLANNVPLLQNSSQTLSLNINNHTPNFHFQPNMNNYLTCNTNINAFSSKDEDMYCEDSIIPSSNFNNPNSYNNTAVGKESNTLNFFNQNTYPNLNNSNNFFSSQQSLGNTNNPVMNPSNIPKFNNNNNPSSEMLLSNSNNIINTNHNGIGVNAFPNRYQPSYTQNNVIANNPLNSNTQTETTNIFTKNNWTLPSINNNNTAPLGANSNPFFSVNVKQKNQPQKKSVFEM